MKHMLIGNGILVTRDEKNTFIKDGCICVEDNIIIEIGKTSTLKAKYADADFVDAKGGVIMPGLINSHNHIYSAFARGLAIKGHNPANFMDILEGLWWKLDNALTLENIKQSAYATYIDCIKTGATTVFDHHASYGAIKGSLFEIASVAEKLGVRTSLCYEVSDRKGVTKMQESVQENEEFINYTLKQKGDMLKGIMGMHAPFTLSNSTLEYVKAHTPKSSGFHIHIAEGLDDVYDSLKKYGKRTVERLFDMDILGEKTIGAHCIHINQREIEILAKTKTAVVHNPQSNMGNAVGCGNIVGMLKSGVLCGLGTDGYTNDMIESYKVGNIIHKHNLCNPSAVWGEIPKMLFENNKLIANRYFNKPLGVLKKGGYADIIITDYDPITPMDKSNINSHILFGMCGRSVVTTIINGKLLMQDRQLLNIDEKEITAKCRQSAKKLWQTING